MLKHYNFVSLYAQRETTLKSDRLNRAGAGFSTMNGIVMVKYLQYIAFDNLCYIGID